MPASFRVPPLLLAAVFLALATRPSPAGEKLPVEGVWEGPLKVGPFEHLVAFTIEWKPDGSLTATADVIDAKVKGIRCGKVTFADGKLAIEVPEFKGRFEGKLSGEGRTIAGRWKQDGLTFPLSLERVEKMTVLRRPQTPTKPYPYLEEDVAFDNPVAGITLAGTLTRPRGDGPFPAVVLISGSGPQDRDETVFLHKPFLVLADHLTRKGVAVLRFDDRGVGKSGGKFEGATSADFATDAHAGVTFLKARKGIDPKRIGVIGHSEGGWVAGMAAADHPADVAFIALLANTGVPGESVALAQLDDFTRALGASAEEVRLSRALQKELIAVVKEPGAAGEKRERLIAAARAFAAGLSEAERKLIGANGEAWWSAVVDRWADPWLQFAITYDPASSLRRVRCPVLALIGEKDAQVRAKENLAAITAALAAGGNRAITAKELPGLNHLFQTSSTGRASEYGRIEETFAPSALNVISDWIEGLKD
jgi:pimeloyl-ACP methyl ester carboxylesterase